VCVIRLEWGSINEIIDVFLDITRGCSIPAGSVVLIGSLTHLADIGLAAYAEDLSKGASKVNRVMQGGVVVLPGLIFPPGGISDPVLTRAIFDTIEWSKTVAKVVRGGPKIMDSCFGELGQLLRGVGEGGDQADYGGRLRLPVSLGSYELMKWDTSGQTGLKNGVGPLATSDVIRVLNVLFADLNKAIDTPPLKVAGLYGATISGNVGKRIILVGASHAKRLQATLNEAGEKTALVETPAFRLLQREVATMTEAVEAALVDEEEAVILVNAVDNSFYVARTEDGHFIPPRKDNSGKYHIDGEIACAPQETAKQLLINLFPLLKRFPEVKKILMVPVPRYLFAPCCSDIEHVPNMESEGHVEKMLADLDNVHKLWRGMIFREKLSNVKVVNVGKLLAEQAYWGTDPVHPIQDGYNAVASYIRKGFISMAEKSGDKCSEVSSGGKRALEEDAEAALTAQKRPFWVTRNDDFVTRRDTSWRGQQGGSGGRGGGGGGWGRGRGRGRGWFY
jgi:hypothetical protein